MKSQIVFLSIFMLPVLSQQASAWGDDGHKVIALIAQHYLTPAARKQVDAILAVDTDPLTAHDIASEATWADKWRDSNNWRDHHEDTRRWHYVDLEIEDPDMTEACYGRKPLPPSMPASIGDKMACIVDKVAQFAAELASQRTDAAERLYALKFLLHLIGDLHQPCNVSDNHDAGGNAVKVIVDGFDHKAGDVLHGYWNVPFVEALGRPPAALATRLLARITPQQEAEWRQGDFEDWVIETFDVAVTDVYGDPPLSKHTLQHLDAAYVARAKKDVARQLSRAGVRLAAVLNKALGRQLFVPQVADKFADAPPNLDIVPTCARAVEIAGRDKEACLEDERAAKSALAQSWSRYNADDKTQCVGVVKAGRAASYVELLSCLEVMLNSKEFHENESTPRSDQPAQPARRPSR
jgi:S1/P1 Nuclease